MEEVEAQRYRFGALERRGVVAGWRGGQVGALVAGLLTGIGLFRTWPSMAGALLALGCLGIAVGAATWPIQGRTAEEWAPDVIRHVAAWFTRRNLVTSSSPAAGMTAGPRASGSALAGGTLGALSILHVGAPGAEVGVLHDLRARTVSAMVQAAGNGFVLEGPSDRDRQVDMWARVLAASSRETASVHRLAWVARSFPDGAGSERAHLCRGTHLDPSHPAYRSYEDLLESVAVEADRHEVLVLLSVQYGRASRPIRAAGGGLAGGVSVLVDELDALRSRLVSADVETSPPLDAGGVAAAIRRGYDPVRPHPPGMSGHGASGLRAGGLSPWPMAMKASWEHLRVDSTWHATFWISEWPRLEVGADVLAPLLVLSGVRRSVALVMEPFSASAAARHVEQRRTADVADAELRHRGGFLATARRRREEDDLARQEAELAEGQALVRYSGYVTVTTSSLEELAAACEKVEQVAALSGLELRRCYGDQAGAFSYTLPLGRGLR